MHYNLELIKIGEKLRTQYLYNVYNKADVVKFVLTKYANNKKINNKILKLTT